ncbi:MAG: redox-sensing transcriptional repressor Rex [Clostridiales bacterium]|jgi:redox-sensing transcriptional repressor|nr:redox-sensing transcriptional repressor Rex [Clostridiales bacterium]
MKGDKKVSMAVIQRLPRYYRYLGDLIDNGIERISSKELSVRMGITASQIRQDLNNFGSFGQQGYGYNVQWLYEEIGSILGLDRSYTLILIGAGNFGQALAGYPYFAKRGYNFTALFDNDTEIIGKTVGGASVFDVAKLPQYLQEHHVDIAVLTLPGYVAQQAAGVLANSGIKGIWNFSGIDLRVPSSMIVENVRLTDSLMTLSYMINEDEILERVSVD